MQRVALEWLHQVVRHVIAHGFRKGLGRVWIGDDATKVQLRESAACRNVGVEYGRCPLLHVGVTSQLKCGPLID